MRAAVRVMSCDISRSFRHRPSTSRAARAAGRPAAQQGIAKLPEAARCARPPLARTRPQTAYLGLLRSRSASPASTRDAAHTAHGQLECLIVRSGLSAPEPAIKRPDGIRQAARRSRPGKDRPETKSAARSPLLCNARPHAAAQRPSHQDGEDQHPAQVVLPAGGGEAREIKAVSRGRGVAGGAAGLEAASARRGRR